MHRKWLHPGFPHVWGLHGTVHGGPTVTNRGKHPGLGAKFPQCTARRPFITTTLTIRLLPGMAPRRRGVAPRGAAPRRGNILAIRVKDHCPTTIARNRRNARVNKRTWTERIAHYRDDLQFSGPAPGYVGSCDVASKEISFFLEIFEPAAKFMLIATNRHIRRHRDKLVKAVS